MSVSSRRSKASARNNVVAARSFLSKYACDGGLFQSDEWARLQDISGHEACPFSGSGFEGHAFVQKLPMLGTYLFLPRGPIVDPTTLASEELKRQLMALAEASGANWIRVEPQADETLQILQLAFGADRVVPAPRDLNPREVLMVSLTEDLGQWLERMKPKARYNVRLAEKHGVTVRFSRTAEDMEAFLDLIYATTNRKAIAPHPKAYYRNFFTALPEEMCVVALAEHEGQPVAAALLVFFEGTAYYLHGGSAHTKRELMAPFLLQFRSMEEAKRRGCLRYDLGGVRIRSKSGPQDTDWDGITRFKQGFDPKAETLLLPGTYDIILSSRRYALYRHSRRLNRLRRTLRDIVLKASL